MERLNVYAMCAVLVLFGFFAGCEGKSIMNILASTSQPKEYGYSIADTRLKTKADTVAMLRLETAIAAVERKNDGRFEVLTWSAALLITLLVIFISVNFIISQAKVKELVEEAIDKKTGDIQKSAEQVADMVVDAEGYCSKIKTLYETLNRQ